MQNKFPVPSELWQKDEEVSYCELCQAMFIPIFVRKHHCRKCGKIFCGYCADFTDKFVLPGETQANIHRVCKTCFVTKALDEWEIVDPSSPSQTRSHNPFDAPKGSQPEQKTSYNPFDEPKPITQQVSQTSQPQQHRKSLSHNPFDHPDYQAPKAAYNPFDHPDYREKDLPKNNNNNNNNSNNNNNLPSPFSNIYNPFVESPPLLHPQPFPNLPNIISNSNLPPPITNSNTKPISNAELPPPFIVNANSNPKSNSNINNTNKNITPSQSNVNATRLNASFGPSSSTPLFGAQNPSTVKNTNPIQYHAKSQPQIQTKTGQQHVQIQTKPQPKIVQLQQPKPGPQTTKPIINSNIKPSTTMIPNKPNSSLNNSTNNKAKETPQEQLNPSSEHYIASKFFLTEAMKKADNADFDCPICFETFQNGDMTARLACFCLYHQHCIETWWRRINYRNLNCPMHDLGTG